MSEVIFEDRSNSYATHLPSGARGELVCVTRTIKRGKNETLITYVQYEALFNFDDDLTSRNGEITDVGKYFLKELGTDKVTSLREAFDVRSDRDRWISRNFSILENLSLNYIEHLIWGLEELSNKKLQMELWNSDGRDGKGVSSSSEALCHVFNIDITRHIEGREINVRLPRQALADLVTLRSLCSQMPENLSVVDEINHPKMSIIRQVALKILVQVRGH